MGLVDKNATYFVLYCLLIICFNILFIKNTYCRPTTGVRIAIGVSLGAKDGTWTRMVAHTPLKRARLPVPPPSRRWLDYYTKYANVCQPFFFKKNAIKYILRGLIFLKKKAVLQRWAVYGKKNRQKAFPSPPNNPIAYRCCCQGTWCVPPQAYIRYG